MKTRIAALALLLLATQACDGETGDPQHPNGPGPLTREELLNPESCKGCHPLHYREWASSMHAYAIDDPVFEAMNRRGQEATDGALGDFCVDCHAPMAVRENAFTNGFAELDDVPKHLRGVTCYFCHNAIGVGDPHNNSVEIANDTTMRGGIKDPVRTTAHSAEYSKFHDRREIESAVMCGSCHDVKIEQTGAHIERTFAEWMGSVFATQPLSSGRQTCIDCHMPGRPGLAAQDPNAQVVERTFHSHLFPGVDVALTPELPDQDIQRMAVEGELANSLRVSIEEAYNDGVSIVPGRFRVFLETDAGHNQPSGAAQDRRMWVEFTAYDKDGNVLSSSGHIGDDEPESVDPDTWMLRDFIYDEDGEETHMFWEAASVKHGTLPPATVPAVPGAPRPTHYLERPYIVSDYQRLARVVVRVRMRPMGFDVLEDLIESNHLDPAILHEMPTFTIDGTTVEWIREQHEGEVRTVYSQEPTLRYPENVYCALEPGSVWCEKLNR